MCGNMNEPCAVDRLQHPRSGRGAVTEYRAAAVLGGQRGHLAGAGAQAGTADEDKAVMIRRNCRARAQPGAGRRGDAQHAVMQRREQRPGHGVQLSWRHDDHRAVADMPGSLAQQRILEPAAGLPQDSQRFLRLAQRPAMS